MIIEENTAVADVLDAGLWTGYRVRSVIVPDHRTIAATVAAARAARPDVAIVSSRPGPLDDGEALIAGLHAAGVPVVALTPVSADDDPVHWGRCLLAGAAGVLPMTADLAELRRVLDLVLTDRPPLCPALVARLQGLAHAAADTEYWSARVRLGRLTLREREVIARLMWGQGAADIARQNVVAEATVRTQIKSILAKLEVRTQLAAVAVARSAGWSTADALALAS